MIDDMQARQLGPKTQRFYIRCCQRFAAFLAHSPETATAEDIRRFQLDLAKSNISIHNRNAIVTGVKFLFRVTLRRPDLVAEFYPIRDPQKIPSVMCPDEIERLLASTRTLRLRVMLSLAYGCGPSERLTLTINVRSYWRGGPAASRRHRQFPEHYSHRPVQGAQRPACHASIRGAHPS
jgi:site-specific recombinase XerD